MKASTQRSLRRYHYYFGIFFAPAILFFSLTGLIQVAGLDERRDGSPPGVLTWMAAYHKHQVPPRPRPPRAAGEAQRGARAPGEGTPRFVALKPFALLTALALFVMTLVGIAIALANRAMRRTTWTLLILGTVIPVALAFV